MSGMPPIADIAVPLGAGLTGVMRW